MKRRHSTWKWPLIVGGGAALLFILSNKRASVAGQVWGEGTAMPPRAPSGGGNYPIQAGTQNIPELPGSMATTAGAITNAASFWNSLGSGDALASGYINFPSGSQAAAALFPVRTDVYGSPYIQWAGQVYILMGPDSMGNYTATQIQV